jgi:formylglycine-generating enzyme required for sulfatase activity
MVLSIDGEDIEGRFGFYDRSTKTYSITFSDSEESETLRDITLNRGVLSQQHEESGSLTETQELRLQAMYTTLAVWGSLAMHLDAMDDNGALMMRGLLKKAWNKYIKPALLSVVLVLVIIIGEDPSYRRDYQSSDGFIGVEVGIRFKVSSEDLSIGSHAIPQPPLVPLSMQWVIPGSFMMGSSVSADDAQPAHRVTLTRGFYMSRTPITQDEYYAVMGVHPSHFHGGAGREAASGEVQGKRPVENVSWYAALVFCNTLSILEGRTPVYRINGSTDPAIWGTIPTMNNETWNAVTMVSGATGFRLPTEAEWEYACRAETTTAYNTGANISDTTGWYNANSNNRTREVGKKPPNKFGLYDMHGNVKEWVWDWHGSYTSTAKTNPTGPSSGTYRVARGGSWVHSAPALRSAYRQTTTDYVPWYQSRADGFRVVRVP